MTCNQEDPRHRSCRNCLWGAAEAPSSKNACSELRQGESARMSWNKRQPFMQVGGFKPWVVMAYWMSSKLCKISLMRNNASPPGGSLLFKMFIEQILCIWPRAGLYCCLTTKGKMGRCYFNPRCINRETEETAQGHSQHMAKLGLSPRPIWPWFLSRTAVQFRQPEMGLNQLRKPVSLLNPCGIQIR